MATRLNRNIKRCQRSLRPMLGYILVVVLLFGVASSLSTVSAATLTVSPSCRGTEDPTHDKCFDQALEQLKAVGGGELRIEGGEYIVSKCLEIPGNTHVIGSGRETVLLLAPSSPKFACLIEIKTSQVTVENLTLTGIEGPLHDVIAKLPVSAVRIHPVEGVIQDIAIRNITMAQVREWGIIAYTEPGHPHDCVNGLFLEGNRISRFGSIGIVVFPKPQGRLCQNIRVVNNEIDAAATVKDGAGMKIEVFQGAVISGNTIRNAWKVSAAFSLGYALRDASVTDNVVENSRNGFVLMGRGEHVSSRLGIQWPPSDNVVLLRNTVRNVSDYAILFQVASQGTGGQRYVVENNIIDGGKIGMAAGDITGESVPLLPGLVFKGNRISGGRQVMLRASGGQIEGNVVEGGRLEVIGNSNQVVGNVTR